MDGPGAQDSVQASNLFADDLFQDPPVMNGYANHIGSSGDSSPMSDFQPWPNLTDINGYGQPSWSAFGLGPDLLTNLTGSTDNLNQRPRSSSALASYSDYLAAFDDSELVNNASHTNHASMDGLNNIHCDAADRSGRSLYQEALNQWTSTSKQGTYEPFGGRTEPSKAPLKPSYSDVAKNRPSSKVPGDKKAKKNQPPPDFTPINAFSKKGRGPRMFNPRSRPNSFSQCAPPVNPNSKYGLDDFDLPSDNKEKFKRSVSADALSHSRRGSSSSVASSSASGIDDSHKPCNLNKFTGASPAKYSEDKNVEEKSKAGEGGKTVPPKQNNETQTDKAFFDPKRIFVTPGKPSNATPVSKTNGDAAKTTILNNDKTRSPQPTSGSSVHKATYINNNLHEGMESRKRTNTEVKQENVAPSGASEKESVTNSGGIKVHFVVSGFKLAYEWIKWALKQSAVWLLVLLVVVLKLVWLVLLTVVYYTAVLAQKVWFFIKKKILRIEGPSDHGGGKFDWSNFPRQPRLEGLEENITLPTTGAEAMKRLLSYKGKDPYSILGLRHDASDEDIKRYYKKQAFLVHPDKNREPGAEEAFKILGHAFDLIGEPVKRKTYDTQQFQEGAMEDNMREFADLLQKFQQKMQEAANMMRCDNCGGKHRRQRTDLPWYSARRCDRCQTRHSAKEGDIWAETSMMGFRWNYYACMENEVYDITELAACQSENFRHVLANSHSVSLRMQTGGGGGGGGGGRRHHGPGHTSEAELQDFINNLFHKTMDPNASSPPPQGAPTHHANHSSNKKKRRNKKRH